MLRVFRAHFSPVKCSKTIFCKKAKHLPIYRGTICRPLPECKVSKGARIRNRYNQVPHLTQDTNGKVTNSQLDTTNESQEGSPFPGGDHKTHINRRAQRHSKHKTEKTHKISSFKSTKDPNSIKYLKNMPGTYISSISSLLR